MGVKFSRQTRISNIDIVSIVGNIYSHEDVDAEYINSRVDTPRKTRSEDLPKRRSIKVHHRPKAPTIFEDDHDFRRYVQRVASSRPTF
jgi:hypothetical protein